LGSSAPRSPSLKAPSWTAPHRLSVILIGTAMRNRRHRGGLAGHAAGSAAITARTARGAAQRAAHGRPQPVRRTAPPEVLAGYFTGLGYAAFVDGSNVSLLPRILARALRAAPALGTSGRGAVRPPTCWPQPNGRIRGWSSAGWSANVPTPRHDGSGPDGRRAAHGWARWSRSRSPVTARSAWTRAGLPGFRSCRPVKVLECGVSAGQTGVGLV